MTALTRLATGRSSSDGVIVTTRGHGDPVVHAPTVWVGSSFGVAVAECGSGVKGPHRPVLQIFPLALLLRIGRPCRRCWVTDPRLVDPYATAPHPYTRDARLELGATA